MGGGDQGLAPGCAVSFKLQCHETLPGEHVRVVGSISSLGSWSPPASTVELSTSAADFPVWHSEWIPIPEGEVQFEYKYVIFGGKGPRWEGRENRKLRAPGAGRRLEISEVFDSLAASREVEHPVFAPPSRASRPKVSLAAEQAAVTPPAAAAAAKAGPLRGDAAGGPEAETPMPVAGGAEAAAGGVAKVSPALCESISASLKNLSVTSALSQQFERAPPSSRRCSLNSGIEDRRTSEVEKAWRQGRRRTVGDVAELKGLTLAARGPDGGEGLFREAPRKEEPPPKQQAKACHRRLSNFAQAPPAPALQAPAARLPHAEQRPPPGPAGKKAVTETEDEEDAATGVDEVDDNSSFGADSDDSESEDAGKEEEEEEEQDDNEEELEANEQDAKVFGEAYEVQCQLGEGAFGAVYKCVKRNGGGDFACKVINKARLSQRDVVMLFGDANSGLAGEVGIQKSLAAHRNIVALHSFFEEPEVIRLVMDVCGGGDLFDEIVRSADQRKRAAGEGGKGPFVGLEEPCAAMVAGQLLSALNFLHGQSVIHRDVKPENVLFARPLSEAPFAEGNCVKLCDFGFAASCKPEENVLSERCGSLSYVAPEVLCFGRRYGLKVDIWSAGAVLFSALRAALPVNAANDHLLVQMARQGKVVFDKGWQAISEESRSAVEHLMVVDDCKRPTASEALEHPWLQAQASSSGCISS
mmetsp:Transcript_64686/g.189243  ORF Transcript_64686/g.189243 Transcript_64686/m.189243 type:complete len:698 (-) Transcript_64686:203-2296(-)